MPIKEGPTPGLATDDTDLHELVVFVNLSVVTCGICGNNRKLKKRS